MPGSCSRCRRSGRSGWTGTDPPDSPGGDPLQCGKRPVPAGKVVVVSVITTFGTSAIAANAVGTVFTNFQVLPGMAMNMGMTAVVARCLGAGNVPQSRYYTRKIIASSWAPT